MAYHKQKFIVTLAMILACLVVFTYFPPQAPLAIARVVVAIFAMVITKATVEFFLDRR
jgi:hypothetical protein